jgi:hypothetical protein
VFWLTPGADPSAEQRQLLAALFGLAGLLLDRLRLPQGNEATKQLHLDPSGV